jgi:hypothetical protein
VIARASQIDFPSSISARNDAQAIEVTQPRERKRASAMRPPSIRAASCRISPQAGLDTSTLTVAPGNSPAHRGF